MRELVQYFAKYGIVFKSLKMISPSQLGSRKKIDIYLGVNLKKYYCCIFVINKKSRFITKDTNEIIKLTQKLEVFNQSSIKSRYIIINAPLCSKAKQLLKEYNFKVMEK